MAGEMVFEIQHIFATDVWHETSDHHLVDYTPLAWKQQDLVRQMQPFADAPEPINLMSMLHRMSSNIVSLKLFTIPSRQRSSSSPVEESKVLAEQK